MSMKRCENGHYFDSSKHTSCPSCGVTDLHIRPTTNKGSVPKEGDNLRQERLVVVDPDLPTRPRAQAATPLERDPGATVPLVRKKMGIDPVVGWLICIEGADRGRDYRIRSERNFIGRDHKMDICIGGDDTIARDNHAIISFNPKKVSFLLMPGDGRGIVYLNEDEVATATELHAYDVIDLGESKLLFVPLCGEKFKWA